MYSIYNYLQQFRRVESIFCSDVKKILTRRRIDRAIHLYRIALRKKGLLKSSAINSVAGYPCLFRDGILMELYELLRLEHS